MGGAIDAVLQWLAGLPAALIYLVIGGIAALENFFPPVPADVVALFGGFLAGKGAAEPWVVFLVVWVCNVAGAMAVYALGRRYGTRFFEGRLGRVLLHPGQLAQLSRFYAKYGVGVVLVSRFLPMFRAVVPIFAGTSGLGAVRTFVPVALASGAWYGLIVYLGATAGRNWAPIRAQIDASSRWLGIAAVILVAGVAFWWWRSRRHAHHDGAGR